MYYYDERKISLENLPTLGGHDDFIDNYWRAERWSAPYIQDPAVLEQYVYSLGLVGATLYEVAIVGDNPGTLGGLGGLDASKFYADTKVSNGFARYEPVFMDDLREYLLAHKYLWMFNEDQPVVLLTDRGAFEFYYADSSTVFVARNSLPPAMYDSNDKMPYFNIRETFPVWMHKIIAFNIITQSADDAEADFCGTYGIELPEHQEGYIREIQFILDNGRRLVMESEIDWGNIGFKSMQNQWLYFDITKVLKILKKPMGDWAPPLGRGYMKLF